MKRLIFTVTTDLSYDQRMIRICSSLANNGYSVLLIGRRQKKSIALKKQPFRQKRLSCFFERGKAFYLEYNLRLFFFLFFKKTDLVCAIDLDTILPCYMVSKIKGTRRVYDAHELFCEMKEIVTRPRIYKFWKKIERFTVPKFRDGYSVNQIICDEFSKMYGCNYQVIRNLPVRKELTIPQKKEKYVYYQGAVNEGRSFETLIPAFSHVNANLVIAGDGNFMDRTLNMVRTLGLEDKIRFLGKIPPDELGNFANKAWIGLTLFDEKGLSNYYSLANRFFDYVQAAVPQLCVEYPAYIELNKKYRVAVLIKDLESSNIAAKLNQMLEDHSLYNELQHNCIRARDEWNWQEEEKNLLAFYQNIFNS